MQKSFFLPFFRLLLPFVHCYVFFVGCLGTSWNFFASNEPQLLAQLFLLLEFFFVLPSLNFLTRVQHFLFITFHIILFLISNNNKNGMVIRILSVKIEDRYREKDGVCYVTQEGWIRKDIDAKILMCSTMTLLLLTRRDSNFESTSFCLGFHACAWLWIDSAFIEIM